MKSRRQTSMSDMRYCTRVARLSYLVGVDTTLDQISGTSALVATPQTIRKWSHFMEEIRPTGDGKGWGVPLTEMAAVAAVIAVVMMVLRSIHGGMLS